MAASMQHIARLLCRSSPAFLQPLRQFRSLQSPPGRPGLGPSTFIPPRRSFCEEASAEPEVPAAEAFSRYKDRPWDYLESEEYVEKYGTNLVWMGYRRNHKGGIPPQKTRKTCIRGEKVCGNPCPICRDPNIIVHPQNVKLLDQFISPYTGMLYDSTRTGVCRKQQKLLTKAINTARDHGLLPFQIPHVEFSAGDYSTSHDAVGKTPPAPTLVSGESWYQWYSEITPDESQVARVKKTYKAYLK